MTRGPQYNIACVEQSTTPIVEQVRDRTWNMRHRDNLNLDDADPQIEARFDQHEAADPLDTRAEKERGDLRHDDGQATNETLQNGAGVIAMPMRKQDCYVVRVPDEFRSEAHIEEC